MTRAELEKELAEYKKAYMTGKMSPEDYEAACEEAREEAWISDTM